MQCVYLASGSRFAGKTFVAIGLIQALRSRGASVGYLKPFGSTPLREGDGIYDADAVFIDRTLGLDEPLAQVSPFVMTYEEQNRLYDDGLAGVQERVSAAFHAMSGKDYVIVGGAGDLFEGAAMRLDALDASKTLGANVLYVEPWRGGRSVDAILGAMRLLGTRFRGAVINKVPAATLGYVHETVRPYLEKEGAPVFGIVPQDAMLGAISVRQLAELLGGRILCCENAADRFVEQFVIGAMDVDSALQHFRRKPNKAVITGAHRSDILLAALETSTRCIVLTGGTLTNDMILGKAQDREVPLIVIDDDTFTAIDRIEHVMGKVHIREKDKVTRAGEVLLENFSLPRFLSLLR